VCFLEFDILTASVNPEMSSASYNGTSNISITSSAVCCDEIEVDDIKVESVVGGGIDESSSSVSARQFLSTPSLGKRVKPKDRRSMPTRSCTKNQTPAANMRKYAKNRNDTDPEPDTRAKRKKINIDDSSNEELSTTDYSGDEEDQKKSQLQNKRLRSSTCENGTSNGTNDTCETNAEVKAEIESILQRGFEGTSRKLLAWFKTFKPHLKKPTLEQVEMFMSQFYKRKASQYTCKDYNCTCWFRTDPVSY